jgi:hypothetical protein
MESVGTTLENPALKQSGDDQFTQEHARPAVVYGLKGRYVRSVRGLGRTDFDQNLCRDAICTK